MIDTFWLSDQFVRIPASWDVVLVDGVLYRRVRDRFGVSDWEYMA